MRKSKVLYNDADYEKWMKECNFWDQKYKPKKSFGDFPGDYEYPCVAVGYERWDNHYGRTYNDIEMVKLEDFEGIPIYETQIGIFSSYDKAKSELEWKDLYGEPITEKHLDINTLEKK